MTLFFAFLAGIIVFFIGRWWERRVSGIALRTAIANLKKKTDELETAAKAVPKP